MSEAGVSGRPEEPVGMRLNQTPAGPGGNGDGATYSPYFASTPAEKEKAAKAIEEHIVPDTRTAGNAADESTSTAIRAFGPKDGEGWATSGGLKTVQNTWNDQVNVLLSRLNGETTSLRATSGLFFRTDFGVGSETQRIPSPLDGY